jgi:hypothetical protein
VSALLCNLSVTVIEIHYLKGKSYWAFYALRRCLAEKKPVMYYFDSRLFLFVKERVYESPERARHTIFKTLVWTLVDTDPAKSGVPPHFAVHGTKHFIIYTTSLEKPRWDRLKKTTQCAVYVMNPWNKTEISKALAHLLPFSMFNLSLPFCSIL